MPVLTTCSFCESKLNLPDRVAGKKVRCPKCGATIQVPGEGGSPSPSSGKPKAKSKAKETNADDFSADFATAESTGSRRGARPRDDDYEDDYDDDGYVVAERSGGSGRSRPSDRDDYDDDYDDDYEDDYDSEGRRGLSGGMISLIVGGSLLLIGGIVGVVIWVSNKDNKDPSVAETDNNPGIVHPGPEGGPGPRPQPSKEIKSVAEARLTVLRSGNVFEQRDAIRFLEKASVDQARRKEVMRALESQIKNNNGIAVLKMYATKEDISQLISYLDSNGGGIPSQAAKEVMTLLGEYKDLRGAEPVAQYLKNHFANQDAKRALIAMGQVAVPAVLKRMNERDGTARARAREILTELGAKPREMVTQCLLDLRSGEEATRSLAAQWLSEAESKDQIRSKLDEQLRMRTVDELVRLLDDQRMGNEAMKALTLWGDKTNVKAVAEYLNDARQRPNNDITKDAFKFLVKYPTEEGARAVTSYLTHFFTKREAGVALREMGEVAVAPVVEHYNSENRELRDEARVILGVLKPAPEVLINQSILDLASEHKDRRQFAAEYLSKAEDLTKEQHTLLARSLNSILKSNDVREQVVGAQLAEKWATEENIDGLIALVESNHTFGPGADAKKSAMLSLGRLKTEKAKLPLIKHVGHLQFAKEAFQALVLMGEMVEPEMLTFLKNTNPKLRIEGIAVLAEIGTEKSLQALQTHRDQVRLVREVAVLAITKIKNRLAEEKKAEEKPEEKPEN